MIVISMKIFVWIFDKENGFPNRLRINFKSNIKYKARPDKEGFHLTGITNYFPFDRIKYVKSIT